MDLFWLSPQPGTLAEHFFCHVVDVAKMCMSRATTPVHPV